MKKPAIIILGILLAVFISIYFIIPQKIQITRNIEIDATDVNVAKFLVNKAMWRKWWPGKQQNSQPDTFLYSGNEYLLQKTTNSTAVVLIKTNTVELPGEISYLAAADIGACTITWTAGIQSSLNPIERISQYFNIKATGEEIDKILAAFKSFMQKDFNVYGINVKLSKVKDRTLLTKTGVVPSYPDMKYVYGLIEDVKAQIKEHGATETNLPMLNIHKLDDNRYQVMVAIPVNQEFKPDPGFLINRMVLDANILETDVKGGKNKLINALTQLESYMHNHDLRSPAMPYELLVTNRIAEPDTSKWVTKIFYPIY